ncbi:hypothetical protein C1701_17025 [Actinoalloteichus sp. AHMU CJ021]|uniref:hypothetical protein n=1 Tax=Actinoalloteichus sp. AHMU CJ021 TaxID=2072503 RepID=UPI000CA005FD|nr:hypothetical protein C1701_17025 [Actinoalloteichus sp. AHMU CJ021]
MPRGAVDPDLGPAGPPFHPAGPEDPADLPCLMWSPGGALCWGPVRARTLPSRAGGSAAGGRLARTAASGRAGVPGCGATRPGPRRRARGARRSSLSGRRLQNAVAEAAEQARKAARGRPERPITRTVDVPWRSALLLAVVLFAAATTSVLLAP